MKARALKGETVRLAGRALLLLLPMLLLVFAVAATADGPRAPVPAVEARVEELLSRMTLDEKLSLLAGTGFDTLPVTRLAIPALHMTDGPAGIRTGPATSFPAGVALAASFDPDLVHPS